MEKFRRYLLHLGHDQVDSSAIADSFSYSINTSTSNNLSEQLINVEYYYCKDKKDLFNKHLEVWNQNNCSSFIAVLDNRSYIIDSRSKPNVESPLADKYIIHSFDYGVDTVKADFSNQLHLISKEGLDNTYYFNFVIEHQKRKKASEVDKDLLLNLLQLRNDLITNQNENTIHLLLLRCLFVKYLEDRGVFEKDFLHTALLSQSPEKLLSAFKKVRKINGDLFKSNELIPADLQQEYLYKLSNFFGYYDYRTKQGKFFPYQFDKIPIQLISNIYESFLKDEIKKGNGVYYTPPFLVNFILRQSLLPKITENIEATFLDPACGSGAFLVEAFKMLIKSNKAGLDYERKKHILQTQVFGIDLDERALQIAAFSLYLALLEGENSEFIREKIRIESPILPSLLGKSLIRANALTDNVFFEINGIRQERLFDCIAANPPWGSVPDDNQRENVTSREAIGNKKQMGTMPVYQTVSDFQRSQAFLLRTAKWGHANTKASMVVNNSIFLNENAALFRLSFLNTYALDSFFELSEINSILFKKKRIGEIKGKSVEIGANEPCCILVFRISNSNNPVHYITPKLNKFTENLRLITYSASDVKILQQSDLLTEDILWRVFVNGNWSDYQIIKKRAYQNDKTLKIECRSGFQPKINMISTGTPEYRDIIAPSDFKRYKIKVKKLKKFNWAQKLRRKPDDLIFNGDRFIIAVRPLVSDRLKFRGLRMSGECVHTDNVLSIKIMKLSEYVKDYRPYVAIMNSKFLGYYFYQISSQWGKGDTKRSTLRNSDIEALPFPMFDESDYRIIRLKELVAKIEVEVNEKIINEIENDIDEIVYHLYNLTTYERVVVNDFFGINLFRKESGVTYEDLLKYTERFCEVFQLMLSDKFELTSTSNISKEMGACVCFSLKGKSDDKTQHKDKSINVINLVKLAQTGNSYLASVLAEEKVKYYDKKEQKFYIIKSNQYKDWTERQAIDDANEEIGDMIKYLRNK